MFTQKPGTFLWGISLYTKKKGAANCRPLRLLKDYHIMLLISRVFYKWSSESLHPLISRIWTSTAAQAATTAAEIAKQIGNA